MGNVGDFWDVRFVRRDSSDMASKHAGKMRMNMGGPGLTGLLKDGYKHFAGLQDAIMKNVEACKQLADITRTSLGPNGMNKLVINHLEKIFFTSDAATIARELEVEHPAAKMMVMAAKMQEEEVGDGSNLVITFAGELMGLASQLLRTGVHPSDVILGYTRAADAMLARLPEMAVQTLENRDCRDPAQLEVPLRSVIASKQFGYEDVLAPLVARACVDVMPSAPKAASINVDSVRVAQLVGGSVADSQVIRGMVVLRDTEGAVKNVSDARVAVFGMGIEAGATETKGTVVLKDAGELMDFNKQEERIMEEKVRAMADAGVNVVVASGSISEIAMHYLEKYDIMTIKIMSKFELRRLCRAIGATALVRLGAPTPAEMGRCDSVSVQELSSRRVTVFRQDQEDGRVATIVLRGSTRTILEDMDRAIGKAVNCAKVLCRDGRLLAGAGATEVALASRLQEMAAETRGLEQYAIQKFAEALEVVPRTLAENSGANATQVLAGLFAAHTDGKASAGVDVTGAADNGQVDAVEAGVFDSMRVRCSAYRLAVDAAVTVLRVDQIIMSKQAGGPKPRGM